MPAGMQSHAVSVCDRTPSAKCHVRLRLSLQVRVDGSTFRPGDAAYVVLDADAYNAANDAWPEYHEVCSKCQIPDGDEDDEEPFECDRCLRVFHERCLDGEPPAVGPEPWHCPECERGAPRPQGNAAQLFVSSMHVLRLVRIEEIWKDADGDAHFLGRTYLKYDETRQGVPRSKAASHDHHCDL